MLLLNKYNCIIILIADILTFTREYFYKIFYKLINVPLKFTPLYAKIIVLHKLNSSLIRYDKAFRISISL